MSLFNIANMTYSGDPTTKPLFYYKKYDDFLLHHKIKPQAILEVGTFKGESAKVLSKTYPDSKIITLDIELREIDFSDTPNVTYLQADQTNHTQLTAIIKHYFPDGIDLVIDDASHVGHNSKMTFDTIFPFVKSGGAYFIEDWGTGYWHFWNDGHSFSPPQSILSTKRITNHDFGMVGFVKTLVDLTHEGAIEKGTRKNYEFNNAKFQSRIEALEFGEGICMALKA